jgi:hydrogenase maturation factor
VSALVERAAQTNVDICGVTYDVMLGVVDKTATPILKVGDYLLLQLDHSDNIRKWLIIRSP